MWFVCLDQCPKTVALTAYEFLAHWIFAQRFAWKFGLSFAFNLSVWTNAQKNKTIASSHWWRVTMFVSLKFIQIKMFIFTKRFGPVFAFNLSVQTNVQKKKLHCHIGGMRILFRRNSHSFKFNCLSHQMLPWNYFSNFCIRFVCSDQRTNKIVALSACECLFFCTGFA